MDEIVGAGEEGNSAMRRVMKHKAFEHRYGKRLGKIGDSLPNFETISQKDGAGQSELERALWRSVLNLARLANLAEAGEVKNWGEIEERVDDALQSLPLYARQKMLLCEAEVQP